MRFPPLGLEKPMNILEPILASVLTSARSTNSPNRSVAKWRLDVVVIGSKDVFRLLRVPFRVGWAQIHYEGVGLWSKSRQIWTRKSMDLADILRKIILTLEPPRVNLLPLKVKIGLLNESYIFDWKLQTRISLLVMVVQPEVYFSRWRLLLSWIWKNCCPFFTIWPIVTKISGNMAVAAMLN